MRLHFTHAPSPSCFQAASRKREEGARNAREIAAIQAQREMERMRLEEQRRKIEAVGDGSEEQGVFVL